MKVPHYAGFIDEDRLETSSSFLTVDANVSRAFFPLDDVHAWTLTLGVRNLTDEFQEDLDQGPFRDAAYVYGPRFPRAVHASLKVNW